MNLEIKDYLLLAAGVGGGVIANALWAWWSVRSKKSRESLRAADALWRSRLNHDGYSIRAEAGSEILVRALYWLVLANVLLGISGLSWTLTFTEVEMLEPVVAIATFCGALVFFAISLRWLNRYLRLKDPIVDASIPAGTAASSGSSPMQPGADHDPS